MKNYETLVDATNDLLKRGYTANLTLDGDTINDNERGVQMGADDFEIDEFYRFEGLGDSTSFPAPACRGNFGWGRGSRLWPERQSH